MKYTLMIYICTCFTCTESTVNFMFLLVKVHAYSIGEAKHKPRKRFTVEYLAGKGKLD